MTKFISEEKQEIISQYKDFLTIACCLGYQFDIKILAKALELRPRTKNKVLITRIDCLINEFILFTSYKYNNVSILHKFKKISIEKYSLK